jgi:hypothetical protein
MCPEHGASGAKSKRPENVQSVNGAPTAEGMGTPHVVRDEGLDMRHAALSQMLLAFKSL